MNIDFDTQRRAKYYTIMLKPFHESIDQLAFVYGYSGRKEDNGNRIYSIAASIIERGKPGKHYNSYVRYRKSTEREHYYSGITKEILQKAPLKKRVVEDLREFLMGQRFVFFLNNHDNMDDLLGFIGDIRVIDLGFAAEFFLPDIESHTPKSLWEHIFQKQRDRIAFSAPEMVDLSIEIVRHICRVHLNDSVHPRAAAIRYFLRKSDTLFVEAFCHSALHYGDYFGELTSPCSIPDTEDWEGFLEQPAAQRPSSKGPSQPFKTIPEDYCGMIYGELGNRVKGFTYRPSQVEYSQHIAMALNTGTILTIEAGTGTGKTLGYLLPAMEFLLRNPNLRVAVSTYTKNLQQQVFLRELELVRGINRLYQDIPVALLKGKSNYICTEKLAHLYDEGLRGKELLAWLYMLNLVYNFRAADGDTLGDRVKYYLEDGFTFRQMQRETSSKIGCDARHKRCPAQIITSEAASARLIITNHYKLALLEKDSQLSGLFTNFIIDEANHFEHAMRDAFAVEVSSRDIHDLLISMESFLNKHIKFAVRDYEDAIRNALAAIGSALGEMAHIASLLKSVHPLAEPGDIADLRWEHPSYTDGIISSNVEALRKQIARIIENLKSLDKKEVHSMLRIHPRTVQHMGTTREMLADAVESIKLFMSAMDLKNSVLAFQFYVRHWSLFAQTVDVADLIRTHILKKRDSVIFTSATLCHQGSFDQFKKIIGLDLFDDQSEDINLRRNLAFTSIPSPFSQENTEIIIPPDAASGAFDNKRQWIKKTAEVVLEVIRGNKGRTLVLFSSYRDLESVAERIADDIMDSGYPLLIQKNGCGTGTISDEFRAIKESVLFGVDTFWYGVDYKGDTLTQVVITRIPFPNISSPLQLARKATMAPIEYRKQYLYETYIKLRQGIGRLIRCETDHGRVIILDSRYHGSLFQRTEKRLFRSEK
ncbi:MAG: hypothetical protein C0392_04580 [Syntrophus sp. (in: bacteria)]|nr:hypothetical protein [Syntrophus sp. (in: bacteria)]